jgi:ABC-type lipoprotein export system ATPase subunit
MTKLYAIYGASGCGRSLMPVARQQLARESDASEIVFIDDALNRLQSKWSSCHELPRIFK